MHLTVKESCKTWPYFYTPVCLSCLYALFPPPLEASLEHGWSASPLVSCSLGGAGMKGSECVGHGPRHGPLVCWERMVRYGERERESVSYCVAV